MALRAGLHLAGGRDLELHAHVELLADIADERQRVLFLEGTRGYDIERMNLDLVPAAGTPYLQGGVYGATVCLPIPDIERFNNPNVDPTKIISGVRGQFTVP